MRVARRVEEDEKGLEEGWKGRGARRVGRSGVEERERRASEPARLDRRGKNGIVCSLRRGEIDSNWLTDYD